MVQASSNLTLLYDYFEVLLTKVQEKIKVLHHLIRLDDVILSPSMPAEHLVDAVDLILNSNAFYKFAMLTRIDPITKDETQVAMLLTIVTLGNTHHILTTCIETPGDERYFIRPLKHFRDDIIKVLMRHQNG